MAEKRLITIENTRFIYKTNFQGDPARDTYGSDARQGNIVIPSYEQAMELMDEGFNVKQTKPREDDEDFELEYYVSVKLNYDSPWPPKVYLVVGNNEPVLLDEDSIREVDEGRVLNVNVILNPYENERTRTKSLYVRTMYVEQDVEADPFAARYARRD